MANLIYATGTVSVDAGGTVVTGEDTVWSNLRQYDLISIDGEPLTLIESVTDETHCVIPEWQGGTKIDVSYKAYQLSPLRFVGREAAADVTKLVAYLNTEGIYIPVRSDRTEPDPAAGEEGQLARQYSTGKEWFKEDGAWVFIGTSGFFGEPVIWSAATSYTGTALVHRVGKIWRSLQTPNLNHPPETTDGVWWDVFLENGDVYDVALYDTDRPDDNEEFLAFTFPRQVTFVAGLTESWAKAKIAAAADAVFRLYKQVDDDPPVQFGTMTFLAGSRLAVFSSAADVTFEVGDDLLILAPTPRDASLSRVNGTLAGYRS